MAKLIRTPEALEDLVSIWAYIAEDNPDAADRWLEKLNDQMRLLSSNPHMGHDRSEIAKGLRSTPVGDYIIFFLPITDGIDIIRVLHGALDIQGDYFG